jgi:hypothetical protein
VPKTDRACPDELDSAYPKLELRTPRKKKHIGMEAHDWAMTIARQGLVWAI